MYRVTLRFEASSPAVTGDWSDKGTAHRIFREWVGLYGSGETVHIQLSEETGGSQRVIKTWTYEHGEVETGSHPRAEK